MPLGGGGVGTAYISRLNIDADLNMGVRKVVAAEVDTDTIDQKTATGGDIAVKGNVVFDAAKKVIADEADLNTIDQRTATGGDITTKGAPTLASGILVKGGYAPNTNSAAGNVITPVSVNIPGGSATSNAANLVIRRAGTYRLKVFGYDAKANGYDILKNGADSGFDLPSNGAQAWSATVDVSGLAAGDTLQFQPKTESVGSRGAAVCIMNADGVF